VIQEFIGLIPEVIKEENTEKFIPENAPPALDYFIIGRPVENQFVIENAFCHLNIDLLPCVRRIIPKKLAY
jgi:hypothetical protein